MPIRILNKIGYIFFNVTRTRPSFFNRAQVMLEDVEYVIGEICVLEEEIGKAAGKEKGKQALKLELLEV